MDEDTESYELSLAELMSMPIITIGPDASIAEVLVLADEHEIDHFPIVQDGRLRGIVCARDLRAEAPEIPAILKGWRHVVTGSPRSSVDDAARLMRLHGVDSVVVADDEGVWGIVTRKDLLDADPALERLLRGA